MTNSMKIIQQLYLLIGFLAVTTTSLTAQNYTLPKYSTFQLKNGLRVYLMEQHDVPLISVSAILPAGAIYDGKQSGLAQMTATALKHGTTNFTKAEIDETLDFIGARISISATKEYAGLSSKFAAKDKESVLSMIKELLSQPVFDEAEFKKEKLRALTALERDKESPRAVIRSNFDKLLFADHPYGNSLNGSVKTVENISVADVKKFYAENYLPNHAAISIVGDFEPREMKKMLSSLFADWKKGSSAFENLTSQAIQKPDSAKVLLIDKEDAKETTFYIGGLGVARNNKDVVAIQVLNALFGGRFTSMLNTALRTDSGLSYGARSRFTNYKSGGSFYISTFTANETTEQAIDLSLEVLHKFHTTGLDEKSLTSAKNYIKGQFPPRYETVSQLSNLLTEMFWYGLDETIINDFEKKVDEVTLEKSKDIIATYFPVKALQFVLIGKASEIRKIADKYGPVVQRNIKD